MDYSLLFTGAVRSCVFYDSGPCHTIKQHSVKFCCKKRKKTILHNVMCELDNLFCVHLHVSSWACLMRISCVAIQWLNLMLKFSSNILRTIFLVARWCGLSNSLINTASKSCGPTQKCLAAIRLLFMYSEFGGRVRGSGNVLLCT